MGTALIQKIREEITFTMKLIINYSKKSFVKKQLITIVFQDAGILDFKTAGAKLMDNRINAPNPRTAKNYTGASLWDKGVGDKVLQKK